MIVSSQFLNQARFLFLIMASYHTMALCFYNGFMFFLISSRLLGLLQATPTELTIKFAISTIRYELTIFFRSLRRVFHIVRGV